MDVSTTLKRSARYAWAVLAILIISYALLVAIGRLVLPALENHQEFVNQVLSQELGIEITTEHLTGKWTRFTPQFHVQNLRIGAVEDTPAVTVSNIHSKLDILSSILNTEIVWSDLHFGEIKFSIHENAEGQWFIDHAPLLKLNSGTNSPRQLDALINIIQFSTRISVEQIAIDIAFFDGTTATLNVDATQIESSDDFHRAHAKLSLGQDENKAELLLEGRGNLVNWQQFDGQAYINFQSINLNNVLSLILRSWEPFNTLSKTTEINALLNAELWVSARNAGLFNLRGKMQAEEIPLNWNQDLPSIKNFSTTFDGWFSPRESWGLQYQKLQFDWGNQIIEPTNISFQQGLGERWHEIALAADHINIDTLKHMLVESEFMDEATAELIDALNPAGTLHNTHLLLDLEKNQPFTQIDTRIDRLSLDSWHHTPATRGLSGYLHWQDESGYFDINSAHDFAMHYPDAYTNFMHYGSAQGRVNIDWISADESLKIAGGPIDIRAEEGEIRAYISLDIPTKGDTQEPQMFLQAGIKNSHSRYLNNYLPTILEPRLLDWLDKAIGDTDVIEAGFIWRGSLKDSSHQQRSIQFYGQFANGNVNYDPNWPALSQLSGNISLDDIQLTGTIDSAIAGMGRNQVQLESASFTTLPDALLAVKAEISAPLKAAQHILLNSPLAPQLATLADWKIEGRTQAKLDLTIPLSKHNEKESYSVTANIESGQMQLNRFKPVTFRDVEGIVAYSDSAGLHSPGISGLLWGQTVQATATTQEGRLAVNASGLLDLSLAPTWRPLFTDNISGTATYSAIYVAPHKNSPATLSLLSNLQGIAIDLPYPLYKPVDQTWPLETSLQFLDNDLLLNAKTESLKAQLSIANRQLASGIISLGDNNKSYAPVPSFKGLLIKGHMSEFDLDAWITTLQANAKHDDTKTSFDTRAVVAIDHLSAAGIELNTVNIDALHSEQLWDINIDNQLLAGNIRVPENLDQPIVARLNYITLPKPELGSRQGHLDDIDPSSLPALDFATEGLRIGDKELGSLAFVMRPNKHGVSIDQIEAEITGITVDKAPSGKTAQLNWSKIDNNHHSAFTGALISDDLGSILKAWDMPMILTTNQAAFLTDLSWQGKPWDLPTQAPTGNITLRFEKGRFFQAPGTTTNALLKVVGLINFDTWLRRLKFDFSDLFSTGVNFDNLKGGLAFEEHQIRFDEPIVVTLPSGKLRLLGQTNLVEETIDARLIATLPVGTNLPWVAALAGGLPAAAGVYITSRFFKSQVDRISSISYKITGDLNNPEVEVDRIFSDKTE